MSGDHVRILELAAASIDFELSRAERDELAAHLATCTSCSRRAAAIRGDARAIRALPLRPLAAGHADVILGRALRRQPDLQALRLVLVAAVLALLAVGLVAVGSELLRRPETPVLPAPTGSNPATREPTRSIPPTSPTIARWESSGLMLHQREGHTATTLPDGRVLAAGGRGPTAPRTSELFDPATGQWSSAPDMASGRADHAAASLFEQAVFVAGGYGTDGQPIVGVEYFQEDAWTPGPDLFEARAEFTVSQLPAGLLFVGGYGTGGRVLASVQVLETDGPLSALDAREDFPMNTARARHAATSHDGQVLVIGGVGADGQPLASVELYELSQGWRNIAPMNQARAFHTATELPGGRVLVVGGTGVGGATLRSAEIYDPSTESWSSIASMAGARSMHAAVLLAGGRVLVVGGEIEGLSIDTVELFDPATGEWTSGPALPTSRSSVVLALLADGGVLVIGGPTTDGVNRYPLNEVERLILPGVP